MSTTQFSSQSRSQYDSKAYSAAGPKSPLVQTTIPRREPGDDDVQIEILFCGICHSDLHQVRNEWSAMPTVYPCVPGHEIIGRVTNVGSAVTKFRPGDLAAVGCLVDSDGTCPHCQAGLEQFCPHMTLTYNSPDVHLGGVTYGGYSDSIVVKEHFVLRVPANLDLAGYCSSVMRRNNNIFSHAPLGCHKRTKGGCCRSRRSRSYGRKICTRLRSTCNSLYHFTKQER